MANWYTSDLHFWHARILEYCPRRPWKGVIEMNEGLIRNWNSVVSADDTIYCLGDFSMAFRPVETYTPRLNGIKVLILGNHDHAHPSHKKSKTTEKQAEWAKKYIEHGWQEVSIQGYRTLADGTDARMNHLPYLEEAALEDKRYTKHRPPDDGATLLCGHVHQNWLTRRTDKGTLMVNVGVDMNPDFRPWSEAEIIEIIKKGTI